MSTPTPGPDDPTPAASPAAPRSRWRRVPRVTGRRLIGVGVVVALLVVGGVVALLLTHGGGRDGGGPGRGGPGIAAQERGLDDGGPAGPGRGDGPGRDGARGPGRDDDGPGRDADGAAIVGAVRSVGTGTLTVARDGVGDVTVRTDDDTRVRGVTTELAALTPGERVVVRVSGTGAEALARSVETPRARVTGTVTLLVGARATVVEDSGLTSAVDVTGLTTKPSVGTRAEFTGVAAANGSVLRADQIRTLPEAR